MKRVILLSVSILLICLGYSFAEVPCKINYQGRLIKDNVPVDGTRTMKFSIHDSAVGGNELWTSGDVNVEVHNGLFRYVIGSDGGDLSSIDWTAGQELYLEVKVETDILTPREELYAYPYAINSHLLEGKTKEYFLNTSADTQTKQGDLNIMGNVGIGTTSPLGKLAVDGNVSLLGPRVYFGRADALGILLIRDSDNGALSLRGGNTADSAGITVTGPNQVGLPGLIRFDTNAIERMRITRDGNVGIGTTSPGAKLDVQGGPIRARGGLIIETRTSDPASPATGQMWLRTDF